VQLRKEGSGRGRGGGKLMGCVGEEGEEGEGGEGVVGMGEGEGEEEGEEGGGGEPTGGGVGGSGGSTRGGEGGGVGVGGVGGSSSGTMLTIITRPILGLFSITTFELSSKREEIKFIHFPSLTPPLPSSHPHVLSLPSDYPLHKGRN
jgi:hypothetical protein